MAKCGCKIVIVVLSVLYHPNKIAITNKILNKQHHILLLSKNIFPICYNYFFMGYNHFLVIGGGGLHQPMNKSGNDMLDLPADYKPPFHYLSILRYSTHLKITSIFL